MEGYFKNGTIEVQKEVFNQMQELLLQFENSLTVKIAENKELKSKVEDLENLMKIKEKAPNQDEMLNRMRGLLKESSLV